MLILNVLPSGIHYLTFNKYLPINFDKTLNFLIQDIKANHPYGKANIFIDNSGRNGDKEIYFILGEFLQFKGLSSQQFDLKSDLLTVNPSPLLSSKSPETSLPFSIFKTDKPDKISSGDYLIIEALSEKNNVDNEYLQSLNKDYKLIFQTTSPLFFPDLNSKTILKIFFSQRLSYEQKAKSTLFRGLTINENLTHSPDYYVFVRR